MFSLFNILLHSEICQISKMGHYSIFVALCAKYFYAEENLSYESLFFCHEIKKKEVTATFYLTILQVYFLSHYWPFTGRLVSRRLTLKVWELCPL